MPGQRITDQQVKRYKELRNTLPQEAAAAKIGISVRTARRIEHAAVLPSQQLRRQWRTHRDPQGACQNRTLTMALLSLRSD